MPELRKDPIIGRWVIIATERAKRPDQFTSKQEEAVPEKSCPFCEGAETQTPPATDSGTATSVVLSSESATSKPVATKVAKSAAGRSSRTPIAIPIVSKALSKYTVTVEFVELVPTSAAPAEGQPAPTTS